MQLEGFNIIHATPEQVFVALQSPDMLAKCVPGVKKLEVESEGVFKTTLEVSVGPVKGSFSGKVSVLDAVLNTSLTLKVEMRAPVGIASAIGKIILEPQDAATKVHWSGEPQLGGMIASVGARLIGGVAKAQADIFFTKLEQELTSKA